MKEASRVINVLKQLHAESQKQLETAALLQHARQGTIVGKLNEISKGKSKSSLLTVRRESADL